MFGRQRPDGGQPLRQRIGDLARVTACPDAGAVDAAAATVDEHALDHHVEVLLPPVNLVVAAHILEIPPALGAQFSQNVLHDEQSYALVLESEADLAGYLVMRAEAGRAPQPLMSEPIKETTFRDATAARGVRYTYTVVAVDAAGNRSAPSASVEESAR